MYLGVGLFILYPLKIVYFLMKGKITFVDICRLKFGGNHHKDIFYCTLLIESNSNLLGTNLVHDNKPSQTKTNVYLACHTGTLEGLKPFRYALLVA
jgi:hypothetical protein